MTKAVLTLLHGGLAVSAVVELLAHSVRLPFRFKAIGRITSGKTLNLRG
jgi:hypothetical protein